MDNFQKVATQLNAAYEEFSSLSKKTPNDQVNKFKLKFINEILANANEHLKKSYKPFQDFELFDENDLPTASDVVFILKQYSECLNKKRIDKDYE